MAIWTNLSKFKMHIHLDPEITLLRISPTEILIHVDETHTNPFIIALLVIAPSPPKGKHQSGNK